MDNKAQVKVQGRIPASVHAKLVKLAEERRTTVGAIVSTAIPHWLSLSRRDAALLDALPVDGRRTA